MKEQERWEYIAYDYGWRKIRLHKSEWSSAIDPSGDWFNERLANMAATFWQTKPNKHAPPRSMQRDGDYNTDDPELISHFQNQDVERAHAKSLIVGNGRYYPDNSMTPELRNFIDLCTRQARQNFALIDELDARRKARRA